MPTQNLRNSQVDGAASKVSNLRGRQIKNGGDGTDPTDLVTLRQLQSVVAGVAKRVPVAASPGTSSGSTNIPYLLNLTGTLAIQSDCCPRRFITQTQQVQLVQIELKIAPTGHSLVVKIYQNSTLWMTLTVAIAGTSIAATSAQLAAATPITQGNFWRVDLTAVGTTIPGSDLAVTIQ